MSAMVALAGPAAAASSGRALLQGGANAGPGSGPPPPPGQVLIPGMHDDYGSLITAMLANQGGMIGEMASVLHPALADPLASLANMMTLVQTSLPDLLAGVGLPFEPSPLVHEMFVKYSNGTKTEADLAMLDKGLDELFSHDWTEDDKDKLAGLMDVKEAFKKEGEPLPAKDLDLPAKDPKQWPDFEVRRREREGGGESRERMESADREREKGSGRTRMSFTTRLSSPSHNQQQPKDLVRLDVKGYKPSFPEKPHDELDDKNDEILAKQEAHTDYVQDKIADLQAKLDAKVDPTVKNISAIKAKATAVAKAFGQAYTNKTAPVNYTYSDAKIKGEKALWTAIYNKTNLGGLKNGSLPKPKWVTINLPKKHQADLLQADSLKLNLTKLAFPTNKGKDPLRPLIDVMTSDKIGDHIAGVTPFLTFRDPILKKVARSRTSVSTKVSTTGADPSALKVYDREKPKTWTDAKGGYKGDVSGGGFGMSKVDLFNFGISKFQYRPCIFAEGYTGVGVGAELLRIRPEGLSVGFDGLRVSPKLIDVAPVLVKVQAVGSQINPELINVEPILVSVSPKVNMAGKAVAKPWQLTKPPKFGPKPKEDKLTLPPYPKPHTLG